MNPWWLTLFIPLCLLVGAFAGAVVIGRLNERDRLRRKEYENTWTIGPGQVVLPESPSRPDRSPPQDPHPRVRFGVNRPGHRRNLRGHRPK